MLTRLSGIEKIPCSSPDFSRAILSSFRGFIQLFPRPMQGKQSWPRPLTTIRSVSDVLSFALAILNFKGEENC